MTARELDVGRALGSCEPAALQVLTLYIPDRDRDGRKIRNHQTWVDSALRLLATIGGGATCLWGQGSWKNEATGKTIIEKTAILYTFVDPDRFVAQLSVLRRYLHDFGRRTHQGEVVVEFDSLFYRIRQYDEE